MVMNIPALENGETELFIRDVGGVVRAAEGKTVAPLPSHLGSGARSTR